MAYTKAERILSQLLQKLLDTAERDEGRLNGRYVGDIVSEVPGLAVWKHMHHGTIQVELQNEQMLADAIAKLDPKERSLLQSHIRSGNNI